VRLLLWTILLPKLLRALFAVLLFDLGRARLRRLRMPSGALLRPACREVSTMWRWIPPATNMSSEASKKPRISIRKKAWTPKTSAGDYDMFVTRFNAMDHTPGRRHLAARATTASMAAESGASLSAARLCTRPAHLTSTDFKIGGSGPSVSTAGGQDVYVVALIAPLEPRKTSFWDFRQRHPNIRRVCQL